MSRMNGKKTHIHTHRLLGTHQVQAGVQQHFKQYVVYKSTTLNKYRLLYTHQRTFIWYVVIWNQTLCLLQTVISLLLSRQQGEELDQNTYKTILLHYCSPELLDKKDCGFGVPAWRLM